jgi:glycogen debranching enzyme
MLFLNEATRCESPGSETLTPGVVECFHQARNDLAALRLFDRDLDERTWIPAAGLPMYIAIFGRDTLTTALQSALLGPELLSGTVAELPKWQGKEKNDWRDEEPGRMLHEAHTGPLALLNYNPRARYYGSVTTSGFYPAVLAELWHWTGDKNIIRAFLPAARSALQWLKTYADIDQDGFYEYLTKSKQGVKHQAWKDSSDAVIYPDGRQAEPPIAASEEQAFVYIAKFLLSEVLWWLDEKDAAKELYREAQELKQRFNEKFWMEEENFLALGLDSNKKKIESIASNAGHCLAAGIVDPSRVEKVAARLLADDLFSGWGIRTLSSRHPAYNPYSYHRGSIWPVEQGTFVFGFMRYGLIDSMHRLAKAFFESAALFDYHRLPEVYAGHPRDADHPFPALYLQANSPQAWSASAVFQVIQSLLGIYPYAPLNLLLVDPHLPDWLPEITLTNLRVGKASCDIRFFRKSDGTSDYEIRDKQGPLHIVRQASPWSLTTGFAERVRDLLNSFL